MRCGLLWCIKNDTGRERCFGSEAQQQQRELRRGEREAVVHERKPVSNVNWSVHLCLFVSLLYLSRVVCNDPSCPHAWEPSHSGFDTALCFDLEGTWTPHPRHIETSNDVGCNPVWASNLPFCRVLLFRRGEVTESHTVPVDTGQSGTAQVSPRRLCCPRAPCDSQDCGPQPLCPAEPIRLQRLLGLLLTDSIAGTRRDFRSLLAVLASQMRRIRARGRLAPHTSR